MSFWFQCWLHDLKAGADFSPARLSDEEVAQGSETLTAGEAGIQRAGEAGRPVTLRYWCTGCA